MWVFGYGSLMWKTDFPYELKIIGHVKGFQRRFWQKSVSHRGTPTKPGRAVTLLSGQEDDKVWGVAYKIAESAKEEVRKNLDIREGAYEKFQTTFYPRDSSVDPFNLMLYMGAPDNPNYAGPQDEKVLAKIIQESVGPSGPNLEYLLNLAQFVRENIPEDKDSHLFLLESLVNQK